MLYRISGRLSGNRSFSFRVDAANASEAVAQTQRSLNEAKDEDGKKVADTGMINVVAKPMEASKSTVYIGATKKPKRRS